MILIPNGLGEQVSFHQGKMLFWVIQSHLYSPSPPRLSVRAWRIGRTRHTPRKFLVRRFATGIHLRDRERKPQQLGAVLVTACPLPIPSSFSATHTTQVLRRRNFTRSLLYPRGVRGLKSAHSHQTISHGS